MFAGAAVGHREAAARQVNDSPRKTLQLEKFRTMVEANFKKHLPMTDYANHLGITPRSLSRLCREVLGVSSLDVINTRLIHEAQRELVYSGNTVKQLAYFWGSRTRPTLAAFFANTRV